MFQYIRDDVERTQTSEYVIMSVTWTGNGTELLPLLVVVVACYVAPPFLIKLV